jgi:hypothetical protein
VLLKREAAELLRPLGVKAHLVAAASAAADHVLVVAVGEPQAMIAGELARDHHQLLVVERHGNGAAVLRVDTRPDAMIMLARDALPVGLHMPDDKARLARQTEPRFRAFDVVEVHLAGPSALPGSLKSDTCRTRFLGSQIGS